ncbi:MAG: UDP-glucose/GDP-mannose dehydrogenase family protein [Rhizobiaceae bacterium]|nr:UDP-glucose/GDP-mannose dehydrogenase family protein [Rhizobiaceae bacterium]
MKIAIVGVGYVGLVSGACFADFGHDVCCIDVDVSKVEALKNGIIPIFEPGLDNLVAKNVASGRLRFATDLSQNIQDAEAIFIAVGTPSRRGDGFADLSYVYAAARDIAASMADRFCVVVNKSTVPVGTGDEVERIIREARPGLDFAVVSNPEFLREGAAIDDFTRPDRIVVGAEVQKARDVMAEVYRPLYLNSSPILYTSRRTAELTKYAANAFLATKITFINEMADICEAVGADVQDVARGMGLDNRIGSKFLHAGPGYGGSCFPKDTLALIKTAQDCGVPSRIVETVAAVNDQRKRGMARRVIAACGGSVRGKTIAVLGLTFKPNTDDMRDAPSLSLIAALQDGGAIVRAFDPEGVKQAAQMLKDVTYAPDVYECVRDAEVAVIVTEWNQFRALDFERMKAIMVNPILVDLRNVYRPDEVRSRGFTYYDVGRGQQAV